MTTGAESDTKNIKLLNLAQHFTLAPERLNTVMKNIAIQSNYSIELSKKTELYSTDNLHLTPSKLASD